MSWLKLDASRNILDISRTLLVTHPPMSWLKLYASRNISDILVTLLVTQPPIGWLKLYALRNILSIEVTLLTSHHPISSSNVVSLNNSLIFVTWETSHVFMWPYFTVAVDEFNIHSVIAPDRSASDGSSSVKVCPNFRLSFDGVAK